MYKPERRRRDRGELKTAQKLIVGLPNLNHQLVTADALHCQAATAQAIVAQGGEYLIQVKDNQQTVRALAEAGMAGLPPLFAQFEKEHGRETQRQLTLKRVDPLDVNFPHVQTVIHVRRQARRKQQAAAWEDAYYLSSQAADAKTPEQWLQTIRAHWGGVEIRNHWRKDACLLEDKTRSRNANLVGNLILLRNLVFHFFAKHGEMYESLPAVMEAVASNSRLALRLVRRAK